MNYEALSQFFIHSTAITYIVLFWLSLYFILSFTILFSRFTQLKIWMKNEEQSLKFLLLGERSLQDSNSIFKNCKKKEEFEIYKNSYSRKISSGLTWLSIIASTSPFIGLFGTVVSILETFGELGAQNSLSFIAPKISEALIATACGILVAIPAYTFHLILRRKGNELLNVLDSEIKILTEKGQNAL